ncbi:protein YIF1B-B-like [Cimex lectularius]|uniref:Protein YIF1 n=1 Tax=Cimex lectularius TaxID=79782 RepID=A0A8I6RAQ5_CIMLE|nr:protein YIF1B-B-like [Cimex lectularius]
MHPQHAYYRRIHEMNDDIGASACSFAGRDNTDEALRNFVTSQVTDTNYVCGKLKLLFFPFHHYDWTRRYIDYVPAKPKNDINSPDLYIPVMAFATYLLTIGIALGINGRFCVETLVVAATQSVLCLVLEVGLQLLMIYLTSVQICFSTVEFVAYDGYKFVGATVSTLAQLTLSFGEFVAVLVYFSSALSFFMVRTLRLQLLSQYGTFPGLPNDPRSYNSGFPQMNSHIYQDSNILINKRQMYFLACVAISQPFFMAWLSYTLHIPG